MSKTILNISLFSSQIFLDAVKASFLKLNPRIQVRNPVMFAVYLGSFLTTILWINSFFFETKESSWFIFGVSIWLWFTVLFANFAEAIAEGRGKAQADQLRRSRNVTLTKKFCVPFDLIKTERKFEVMLRKGELWVVPSSDLRAGDIVFVEAGDCIPGDGEVIEGIASVDESAITGESAPVVRESGGDRSAATGGTNVISDWLIVRITTQPGESFWIA